MTGNFYGSYAPAPAPQHLLDTETPVPQDWNATIEKEWCEVVDRYTTLSAARSVKFNQVISIIEQMVKDGGPASFIQHASEVRRLLRPFDATASAK